MFKQFIIVILLCLSGCYQSLNVVNSTSWCVDEYVRNHDKQQIDFPITVFIDKEMDLEDQEAVIIAAATWNKTMNAPIFIPIVSDRVKDRMLCSTVWVSNLDITAKHVGYAWWNACSADCRLRYSLVNRDLAIKVMIHELGHALNLRHEDDDESIMYDYVNAREDQDISDLSKCLVENAIRESIVD